MEQKITFQSDGLKLAGIVDTPPDLKPGERRPAFVVLHGFGGNKDGQGQIVVAKQFNQWGYVTLRVDFRGCGESEGEHGRIICLDQVADTRNAISYMAARSEVDPQRIALVGSSFGAAVAVFTGGADQRVAAVISCGGWGDGERKFRGQHPTPEAWERFTAMLERGRKHKEATGQSLWVSRWDVVPIPEHLRKNLPSKAQMEVPVETAQSMLDFRAEDVVARIAPRPLMLLHTVNDQVTPTEQSIRLSEKAGNPTELFLITGVSHFPLAGDGRHARAITRGWLDKVFSAAAMSAR